MTHTCYISGARIVGLPAGEARTGDVFIEKGVFCPSPGSIPKGVPVIKAHGRVAIPGLVDIHVHLREPGNTDAETVKSGSQAAARGGFAAIVAMPNTDPACDTPEAVARVLERGKAAGFARILPAGAITVGRAGRELADLAAMARAGAVAFTDDGTTPADTGLMRKAMMKARELNRPILDHAQQPGMAAGGVMHDGEFSKKLGLPGMPSAAESAIVERDIALCAETGCRVHIQHVSSVESLTLIRKAKARGLPVTCEVTPHHLALTDADVYPDNTSFKINPPLRSARDRDALRQAIADGVIDAFATDHAPHTERDKDLGFVKAPFGAVGLETAVAITYTELVKTGVIGLARWIELWTSGPAKILGLESPSLRTGRAADLVLLDLDAEWEVTSAKFASKSRNTPFEGRKVFGRAAFTFVDGKQTWPERVRKAECGAESVNSES